MSPTLTTIIALAILVAVGAWDIYLDHDDVKGNTLTAVIRKIGKGVRLTIPFAMGLVVGHLWL